MSGQQTDWKPYPVKAFDGGINTQSAPEDLKDGELVDCLNVVFQKGALSSDTGYTPFGQVLYSTPTSAFQFFNTNGADTLFLSTFSALYYWGSSANWWFLCPFKTGSTTTTEALVAGATSVTVASVTGFAVGNMVGIANSDGTQSVGKILTIASLTIFFDTPIAVGKTVNNGAAVYVGTALHGTGQYQPQWLTLPWSNSVLFTDGETVLIEINSSSQSAILPVAGLATFICRGLNLFHELVLLSNTIEDGTEYPQRIRNSDQANETNFTTGLAGLVDLQDTEDFILSLNQLGPWIVIYRETSIMRGTYFGGPIGVNPIIFWEYMISGEGLISTGGVAEIGSQHAFVGNAGIYLYNGGYDLESIGDNVFWSFLSNKGDLNPSARNTLVCFYVLELDELWILYPSGTAIVPNKMLRMVLDNNSIFIREFANLLGGYGYYQSTLSTTWSALTIPWNTINNIWVSQIFTENSPTTLLCDAFNKQVYQYDYKNGTDNGTVIPWSMTTKDFSGQYMKARLNRLILDCGGGEINVEVSLDRGATWQFYGTAVAPATPGRVFISRQLVSDFFRFKFSGTGAGIIIKWLILEWAEESEW
ncbi:MAG: hypothetical protein ACRDF4_03415 [Rhabdochlamydiaceae bacterium]